MKYTVTQSTRFKKDYKIIQKRGYDLNLLREVIAMLADDTELPAKYKDHSLKGEYANYRECHITLDWLLVYRVEKDMLILVLTRTGTHSDLMWYNKNGHSEVQEVK